MKKTKLSSTKKLALDHEVVRVLADGELSNVAGGITSTCTAMCSATTACHCFPKTMYPTD